VCDTTPYPFSSPSLKNSPLGEYLIVLEQRFWLSKPFFSPVWVNGVPHSSGSLDASKYAWVSGDPWPSHRPQFFVDPGCLDLFCGSGGPEALDVRVTTRETSPDGSAADKVEATRQASYSYRSNGDSRTPRITSVYPRYGSPGDVFTLRGSSLGVSLKDYTSVYFGIGPPPQGGNLQSLSSSALCRADVLNAAASPDGDLFGNDFKPVSVDDVNPAPIQRDQLVCRLGDFEAFSGRVQAFMGLSGLRPHGTGEYLAGLTELRPGEETSVDAKGEEFAVQVFPHVSDIEPRVGSKVSVECSVV